MEKTSEQHTNLIQQANAGNDQAFATLINLHKARVFRVVQSVLTDFDDVDDAAQETFVTAYRHLCALQDPHKFPQWLSAIARNVAYKTARKRVLQTRGLERYKNNIILSHNKTPDPVYNTQTLKHALQTLAPSDRTVTTLFYLAGLDQDHIAKLLNIPIGTVKSRLHRSRTQLKRRLSNMAKENTNLQKDYGRSIIGGMRGHIHWEKLIKKEGLNDFRTTQQFTETDVTNVWTRTNDTFVGQVNSENGPFPPLMLGDPSWRNYELSLLITPISGGNAQIFFRMSENNPEWYLLDFLMGWQALAISKVDHRGLTKLSVVNYPLEHGQEYDVQIAARDASLTSYIDGKLVNQVTDFTYNTGVIALNVWQSKVAFRDLRFRHLH